MVYRQWTPCLIKGPPSLVSCQSPLMPIAGHPYITQSPDRIALESTPRMTPQASVRMLRRPPPSAAKKKFKSLLCIAVAVAMNLLHIPVTNGGSGIDRSDRRYTSWAPTSKPGRARSDNRSSPRLTRHGKCTFFSDPAANPLSLAKSEEAAKADSAPPHPRSHPALHDPPSLLEVLLRLEP